MPGARKAVAGEREENNALWMMSAEEDRHEVGKKIKITTTHG